MQPRPEKVQGRPCMLCCAEHKKLVDNYTLFFRVYGKTYYLGYAYMDRLVMEDKMNVIDAHKIIYDFINVCANHEKGLIFRKSELQNSAEEIEAAYKLYYAHIVFFRTETPLWVEQFDANMMMLPHFTDDDIANQLDSVNEEKKKISTPLGVLFKRNELKELEKSEQDALKKMGNEYITFMKDRNIQEGEIYTGLTKEYRRIVIDFAEGFRSKLKDLYSRDKEEFYSKSFEIYGEYCEFIYSMSQSIPSKEDFDFFVPFSFLYKYIENDNHDKDGNEVISGYYKNYIIQHFKQYTR